MAKMGRKRKACCRVTYGSDGEPQRVENGDNDGTEIPRLPAKTKGSDAMKMITRINSDTVLYEQCNPIFGFSSDSLSWLRNSGHSFNFFNLTVASW